MNHLDMWTTGDVCGTLHADCCVLPSLGMFHELNIAILTGAHHTHSPVEGVVVAGVPVYPMLLMEEREKQQRLGCTSQSEHLSKNGTSSWTRASTPSLVRSATLSGK